MTVDEKLAVVMTRDGGLQVGPNESVLAAVECVCVSCRLIDVWRVRGCLVCAVFV